MRWGRLWQSPGYVSEGCPEGAHFRHVDGGNPELARFSAQRNFSCISGIILGMKRGLALTLLIFATCVVVSAQVHSGPGRPTPGVHASATNLPPRSLSSGFGHNPGFRNGFGHEFGHHEFRRRFYPGYVYYWPYYGYYGGDYPYNYYSSDTYQPQDPPTVAADPKPSEDEQWRAPQVQAPPAAAEEQEATLLVFRDGHQQEIRNYAIVGQMLWDFGAKGTRKIPLSDLDLDTTRKLNDERGVEFVLPKT